MAEEKAKKNTSSKTNNNSKNRRNNRQGQANNRRKSNQTNRRRQASISKKTTPSKKVAVAKEEKVLKEVTEEKVVTEVKTPTPKEKTIEKSIPEIEIIEPEEDVVEVEESIEEEPLEYNHSPEEQLEKTLIFDGTQSKNLDDVVDKLEEDNVILDDKVIKRSKTKKGIIVILILLIICILAASTYYIVNNEITPKTNQTMKVNVYKKVSKLIKKEGKLSPKSENPELEENYEHLETISLADLEQKIMNREDMIVLVASTNCYHCAAFEPVIEEVFAENNQTIYRINVISLSNEEVDRFRSYYYFTKTPTIFQIKDGYVVAELLGSTTKDDLTNWLKNHS